MAQMKDQIKTLEKELNEMEISNLSDAENTGYKDVQGTQGGPQQCKKKSEMKNALIEIKSNLQGNNSRVDEAENQINNMEHKEAKNNHAEQQEEKKESPPPQK